MIKFTITKKDNATRARCATLRTKHHDVQTPNFMPVATQATVKTQSPADLKKIGIQVIICNTYHLMLRPTSQVISELGGLHRFMNWDRAILTDSGGFQAYSLTDLRKVNDDGIEFSSHLDGSRHFLTPESAVLIQEELKPDIAMCLDVFSAYPTEFLQARIAVERTVKWAERSLAVKKKVPLFAIIQGATYKNLRHECAERIVELNFPGYGIGGLMIGEPSALTNETVQQVNEVLPEKKPRYLMGCGYPEDIIDAVAEGVDLFDCVLPTRNGRTGMAFTSHGKIIIKGGRYATDKAPLDRACNCYTCRHFSRAYLRHLFNTGEALAGRLVSHHNLYFYIKLMSDIRSNIKKGTFSEFAKRTKRRFDFRNL